MERAEPTLSVVDPFPNLDVGCREDANEHLSFGDAGPSSNSII